MTQETLKSHLDELVLVQTEIVVNCDLLAKNLRFLTRDHGKGVSDVLTADKFFVVAGNCMWDILILELFKLFYKKEAYSLSKTLNILIANKKAVKWNHEGDFSKIDTLKKEMESEEFQKILFRLNHIRDKKIAHLDRDRFDKEILVNLDQVQTLITNGQNLLSEINIGLNGIQLLLNMQNIGFCEATIKNLVAYNDLRIDVSQ